MVMAPVLCMEAKGDGATERFSDRKIREIRPSAIDISVTKSSGLLLRPLLAAMADRDREICRPPVELRRNLGAHLMFSIGL